ncbi:MAG: ATP-binding protein [bacterium]
MGVLAAALFAMLVVVRAIDLRAQREQLLRGGDRRAANLAVVLTGYLEQAFAAVDASLRQLSLHSERIGGSSASAAEWNPALLSARAALRVVGSISVVDSTGVIRHSTQPAILGQSRSDRYVFRRLVTDTTSALITDPPFRIVTGTHAYMIPLARRLTTSRGRFSGIIVATFVPDELREVFRSVDVGQHGEVTVFHRDGVVVFREPSDSNPIGELAEQQPTFEAARRVGASGVFQTQAAANGPTLRTAARSLADRGLILTVSLDEDELLDEWRRDTVTTIAVALVLAFALVAIIVLMFREMDIRAAAAETLSQSQRLESIGRLTGGIAHDFNNLLGVILGNAELIKEGLGTETVEETHESAIQIERAAHRGAALIRQLLAFARRQPLQPRITDLAALVRESKPMLDRVLGEDVALRTNAGSQQFPANVDPVGAESALLNLCLNARDAMPNGGTIDIDLSSVIVDAQYARANSEATPGRYVVVSVSDSGGGIPDEHLAHLFEPFYTTKGLGRGTGLGLSSVYGFVKQSSGHAKVTSEMGRGTTVKLFFPEASEPMPAPEAEPEKPETSRERGNVVLVVEDEPDLLALASRFLQDLGYRVVRATSGPTALVAAAREPHIDLLLTDIVMPGGMSGRGLAAELLRTRPGLPVVYASGYSEDAFEADGHVGGIVVAKPYDRAKLTAAVQEALRLSALGQ